MTCCSTMGSSRILRAMLKPLCIVSLALTLLQPLAVLLPAGACAEARQDCCAPAPVCDADCPPCACCALGRFPGIDAFALIADAVPLAAMAPAAEPAPPSPPSRDILHVPRTGLA
jgi:hypothetical protein